MRSHQDQGGGVLFQTHFSRHKQNKGENKALSSHLSPFPTPGVLQKEQRGFATPLLGWFDGFFVAAESRICCAELSANPTRFFPKRFTIFFTIISKYILIDFYFFFLFKVAVVQWAQTLHEGFFPLFKFSGRIRNRISLVLGQI